MSKQEILKSVLLGSLVIASLAFGSFKASAADFNQIITSKSEAIPAIGFLQKTGKNCCSYTADSGLLNYNDSRKTSSHAY